MMRNCLLVSTAAILFILPAASVAQTGTKLADEKKQILGVIENMEAAWAAQGGFLSDAFAGAGLVA